MKAFWLWTVAILLLGAPRAVAACPGDPLLAEEAPDVVFTSAIRAKAAELGFDPVRIYEFVRNEVDYQPYYGLMRGPDATLRGRRGNEYDTAALLVSLLRISEDLDGDCTLDPGEDLDDDGQLDGRTRARFVRGRIRVPVQAASEWTAAASGDAAALVWRSSEPHAWRTEPILGAASDGTHVEKLHVWVEAEVPMARYRGSGVGASGRAWVPLDASYKLHDLQPGIDLPIGYGDAIEFDYDTYYSSVAQETPREIFERQIRDYLATNQPGKTVADVPIAGPIRTEAPGVLPNALPYELSSQITPARDASLVPLHEDPGSGGLSPHAEAGTAGADHYRWRATLRTCDDTGQIGSCGTEHHSQTWDLPELGGRRVVLQYPPVDLPSLDPTGYTQCWPGLQTQPQIVIDGSPTPFGPPATLCDDVDVVVFVTLPLPMGET